MAARGAYEVDDDESSSQAGVGDYRAATGGSSSKRAAATAQKATLPRGSACLVCRKRKLKCGGERPACNTCTRLNHECGYGDPVHTRLMERTEELEDRIRLLESELEAYRTLEPPHAGPSRDGRAQLAPIHAVGTNFPSLSISNPHSAHSSEPSPFLHSPAPPFVYGGSPGARGPSDVADHLSSPLLEQHSPFGPSQHTYSGREPQDSDAFPLPSPIHAVEHPRHFSSASNLQSFPFATSSAHNLSDILHPVPDAYNLDSQHRQPLESPLLPHQVPGGAPPHLRAPMQSPASAYQASHLLHQHDGVSETGWNGVDAGGGLGGSLLNSWGQDLPPMDLIHELTTIYFLTTHQHLPFINRPRFLYALHNPSSLARTPSVSFLFALLAISAPYHSEPGVRSRAEWWYERARERVQVAINSGVSERSHGKVNLTIETIQTLALLTMIEMGKSDHQRAFLSLGQAVRVAAMLGLHRMDEDRIADRTGVLTERRLRPPALHPLPSEPILLEECRRTMCALFVLDRFEAGGVGWPVALSESDIRILLPCADSLYEQGTCDSSANPIWWPTGPTTIENEEEMHGLAISSFAWLCRVVWLGGRICFEAYRPAGAPFDGPFGTENMSSQMDDVSKVLEMDHQLNVVRHRLNDLATVRPGKAGVNAPILQSLILLNCLFVNLHHLRVALGLSSLPFNPAAPIVPGSPEYSMKRCLEGIHSTYEIVAQLATYENMRTSPYLSRVTTFTTFVPYLLYCVAFPAKFCIGDWQLLAHDRSRSEGIAGRVIKGNSGQDAMPSGDDVFGPMLDADRLNLIDTLCNAMDRMGVVWDVGVKFSAMVRGDRHKLAERAISRQDSYHSPTHSPNSPSRHSQASQASHGSYP